MMVLHFENTQYFQALKKESHFPACFSQQRKTLPYKYSDMPKGFEGKYSSENWIGRKFTAIPRALWLGTCKTIFHLTKAIFIGSIKRLFGDHDYQKVHFFHFCRDLQGSFGSLITLFNDKWGQYHFQESQFYHNCYDNALNMNVKNIVNNFNSNNLSLKDQLKEEFSLFTTDEIVEAVNSGVFKGNEDCFSKLISDSQFKSIDFEKIRKISYKLISETNLLNEKLPLLSCDELKRNLMHSSFGYEVCEKHLSDLSPPQLIAVIEKMILQSDTAKGWDLKHMYLVKNEVEKRGIAEDELLTDFQNAIISWEKCRKMAAEMREKVGGFGGLLGKMFSRLNDISHPKNHQESYEKLGLEVNASKGEVRKRFLELTRKYHPDKNLKRDGESDKDYDNRTTAKFGESQKAYNDLMSQWH